MPVVIDGGLIVEVIPEVLVAQKTEELGLDDIDRLTKEVEAAAAAVHSRPSAAVLTFKY